MASFLSKEYRYSPSERSFQPSFVHISRLSPQLQGLLEEERRSNTAYDLNDFRGL